DILKRDDILLAPRYGWYGDGYAQWRDHLLTAGKLQLFDEYAQGLAMLQVGRGTLIMGDEAAMQWEAGVQGLQLRRQFVANASPVHLMLSRRTFSEADVARINAALVAVQSTSGPAAGAASQ